MEDPDMAVVRRADVAWQGNLAQGSGRLDASSSRAFKSLPVTWASRTEEADGRTSPEELLASAHASCYAMAFSAELAKAGAKPESLDVTCEITFDRVDGKWTVISSHLTVRGRAGDIDAARFAEVADLAKSGCPISRAIQGNVALSVHATLESGVPA
jgi:osmotically inducible protein OsmC